MILLTEEKLEILKKFIFKLLFSELKDSKIFTNHEMNYLFRIGYERGSEHFYSKILIEFEFSKHYIDFEPIGFYMMFFVTTTSTGNKKMRMRYNENRHHYNNTVYNLTLHNINKIFSKINLNLNKMIKSNSIQHLHSDLVDLLEYDIENLLHFFEKKMLITN